MKTLTSKRNPAKVLLWSGLLVGIAIFLLTPSAHAAAFML
ncbi:hypothetical protein GCM10011289_12190 [Paludibacterium paludis]|uniref:Uncharacterized protein n=1 Tax=Paludibacterium paludis TaxID=1225769 RepID=A0A918P1Y2_9NEIS|nr:hypothetical protein GCM10011289_12190 [Paludibacterium paludis]